MGISHSWNGTVLTITSDSGTSSADLKGDIGIRGPQGPTGDQYKPKYGVDYFTEEEVTALKEDIKDECAPSGYGLGTAGAWASDLNNATESGFYAWTNTTLNSPFGYGNLLVLKRGSENARITQIGIDPYMSGTGAIAVRHNYADGWYDWEYLNPPMTLNVEYKTTERYGRKRVYTKAVDCGTLPNADRKNFSHSISNMKECLSAVGVATGSGGFGYNFPLYSSVASVGQIGIYVNSNAIQITTTADWSGANAVVILKYTKTTD